MAEKEVISKSTGGSGYTVSLHPLVLINITDHFTRATIQGRLNNPQVRGALLGVQQGREIEIINSFELVFEGNRLDVGYLREKQEQFRQVFPNLDFLGWYNTCQKTTEDHIAIHKQFLEFNESPLYLQLDPQIHPAAKDLPIAIYESSLEIFDGNTRMSFIELPYKIETGEAERIAVNHVAKIRETGNVDDSQLATHLGSQKNAIWMLHSRVKILLEYLIDVKSGKLPVNHDILREISSLCQRLPAMELEDFKAGLVKEYNDVLLATYLATITKGVNSSNELVEKFNLAHERHGRKLRGLW